MVKKLFILLLITANFGCDQLSKNLVRAKISGNEVIDVIGQHFVLTRVENTGAFLSTGESLHGSFKFIVLAVMPLLLLGFSINYLLYKKNLPKSLLFGMSFVIGGGLGNLYDRFIYGSVTDFIYADFYLFKTGIFNFADLSILIGLVITAVYIFQKNQLKLAVS